MQSANGIVPQVLTPGLRVFRCLGTHKKEAGLFAPLPFCQTKGLDLISPTANCTQSSKREPHESQRARLGNRITMRGD